MKQRPKRRKLGDSSQSSDDDPSEESCVIDTTYVMKEDDGFVESNILFAQYLFKGGSIRSETIGIEEVQNEKAREHA